MNIIKIHISVYGKGIDLRVDKKNDEPASFTYFDDSKELDEDKIIDAIEKIMEVANG